jgi:hypothetical protein
MKRTKFLFLNHKVNKGNKAEQDSIGVFLTYAVVEALETTHSFITTK